MKLVALTVAAVLAAGAAQAELKICNTLDARQTVAVAYMEAGAWVSQGWWQIKPGACANVVKGDLKQRHFYYSLSDGGTFAGAGYSFCATAKTFKLSGADGDCAALGAEVRPFSHIDTGATATGYRFDLSGEGTVLAEAGGDAAAVDSAAAIASFAPGTHGEPFTVEALLQNCDDTEMGPSCTFYAEGARWIASFGDKSNDAALEYMKTLPVNAPMIVSGDQISMGDITVEAAVSKAEPGQRDAYADQRDAMQGDWVDESDAKSTLSVVGSEETASYDGQQTAVSVLGFADACPGGDSIGPVVWKQEMGGDPMDTPCFVLVAVSPTRMELSYVGRGNTLVYVRP